MSIESKIGEWFHSSAGQKRVQDVMSDYRKRGIEKTAGGSYIVTDRVLQRMAQRFRELVIDEAEHCTTPVMGADQVGLPESVMRHIRNMYASIEMGDEGVCRIYMWFTGDTHRPSVYEEGYPNGIDNIVALFNNGYYTAKQTYGFWDGHPQKGDSNALRTNPGDNFAYIRTRNYLPPTQFLQSAVERFNEEFSGQYNVTVSLDDIYSEGFNVYMD